MALSTLFCNMYCNNSRNLIYIYQSVRTLKSDLKIKWVRPEKISCIKPEKSGDLEPREPLDLTQYPLELKHSKELETANEFVKRKFSLEFNPRFESVKVSLENYINLVKRHQLDRSSFEAKIAGLTATIRQLQEHMEKHPRDKVNKVVLKELIDKRRRSLRILRGCDYKRYEWVLEKLNIVYKPKPEVEERVERKRSLRKLTDLHCKEIREKKISEYKAELQSQQENFLRDKAEKLKWIMEVEKNLEIEPSVTEKDINEVYEKINMLQLDMASQSES